MFILLGSQKSIFHKEDNVSFKNDDNSVAQW